MMHGRAKKTFPFLMTLFLSYSISGQSIKDYQRTAITNPSISRRCKELLDQRKKKITHKQRLKSLMQRNAKLQKLTPINRKTLKENLQKNHRRLRYELKYTQNKIRNQEETIIRKGCPGIKI